MKNIRFMKRKLAAVLAVLLMLSAQPVLADNTLPQKNAEQSALTEISDTDTGKGISETQKPEESGRKPEETDNARAEERRKESGSEETGTQTQDEAERRELLDADATATSSNAVKDRIPTDEVKFNTGDHVFSVVGRDDFFDKEIGDAYFEEDGSYTINILEENPFFPYEVQFTYKGKTMNQWFMDPDDSVEVGGHTFCVSAYFDGTVVTQMSFDVAGETVVVYPEKKKFTDTEEGVIDPASLLPLKKKYLTVDLMDYTQRAPRNAEPFGRAHFVR